MPRLPDVEWHPTLELILHGLQQRDLCCLLCEDGVLCAPSRLLSRPEGSANVISSAELFAATGMRFARERGAMDAPALLKAFA